MNKSGKEMLEIRRIRNQIDEIDYRILDLLKERRGLALSLVPLKMDLQLKDHEERVKKILDRIERKAVYKGMNGKMVRELWKEIIEYMIREQEDADYPIY